jgi:amino acid adenylation domain-containing protein
VATLLRTLPEEQENPSEGKSAPLPKKDRQRVLIDWNRTAIDHRPEATIHGLFREVAAGRPEAPAVLHAGGALSYGELDRRSNRLARTLRDSGIGPDVAVGLCADRSPLSLIALLGILKAGGAYLPLDPTYPRERLEWMLEDAKAPLLLAEGALVPSLPSKITRVVPLEEAFSASDDPVEDGAATAASSAYIIFTSGSTGRPKGTVIPHRAVNRLVREASYAHLGPQTTLLHAAPLAFDASTFEIWGALLNGGRVALHSEIIPTARGLAEAIRQYGVTTLWLTASLFNAVIDEDPQALGGVRELLTGGEALSVAHVRRALQALPDTQLINGYGPTESTTFTCCFPILRSLDASAKSIPIGRPIRDTTVYVLDAQRAPVAIGATGELYIGGEGLSRGYLGRPDLTAERFIPDPFSSKPGARLYRTGDLVRWLPDGTLDYLGRADDQVKVRGFRIELGEIEAALAALPSVRSAAVLAREDQPGVKRLVAYLVAQPGAAPLDHSGLRSALARTLPEYMVPSAAVWLPALPVTANGKLDRRALPAPPSTRPTLSQEFVAPATDLERRLAGIWSEILGIEPIGREDGFFDLGGSSLLALRLLSRIRQELGADVPAVKIFEQPSLAALAAAIEAQGQSASARPTQAAIPLRAACSGAVAVVGMAGRFPGARDVETFWKNLCDGVDGTTFFAEADLDPSIPLALRRDPAYVRARGIVEGVDLFDAAFFGMSPREAEITDPQQRIFLETAWEALEHSGHVPESFPGPIGVFAGKYNNTYFERNVSTRPDLVEQFGEFNTMAANEKDYVATRTAFKLDLTGPALSIHTACSTSLVTICQAVESLRRGSCDLALAGGSSVTVPVKSGYLYQEGAMLSSDGRCRPFDAKASGTTFSDGVAVVVLRRLEDALADGDTIYAVIRGVAVTNDGARKASFTAPSVEGQRAAIARALADAGVDPRSVSYVETHGTATPLGDPIEVEALTQAFRSRTQDKAFCAIGSVKSNIGHLTIPAGAAGLIKTTLALHHELLPATLHFQSPNPHIDFASSPFYVLDRRLDWKRGEAPRRAGVSAFGVGGTNAHVVLEEAPLQAATRPGRPYELLLLSARNPEALDAAGDRLAGFLETQPSIPLADIAHTLQIGRANFSHRRFAVAASAAEAAKAWRGARQQPARKLQSRAPSLVFMFPGQGAQYVRMGQDLQSEAVFREAFERICDRVRPHLDRDLREVLYPAAGGEEASAEILRSTAFTQPALFAIEYALATLWQSWGIAPAAMIGHSVGEFVCAALSGVMTLEDAASLVAIRGRLMQDLPGGAMLAVPLSAEKVAPRLSDPQLAVASENSSNRCVVSGPHEAVARLQAELEAQGLSARPLHTSHAFHSPMMDPIVEPFAARVREVKLSAPRIPFVSTVSGTWITPEQARDPLYWARHLRQTVRFASGVQTLRQEAGRLLLEVGPRGTLTTLSRQQAAGAEAPLAVSSLADTAGNGEEWSQLLRALGELWQAGVRIDWRAFRSGESRRRVVLPTYPFQRKRHWIEPSVGLRRAGSSEASPDQVIPGTDGRAGQPASGNPMQSSSDHPEWRGAAPESKDPLEAPAVPSTVLSPQPLSMEQNVPPSNPPTRLPKLLAGLRDLFEEVTGEPVAPSSEEATFYELGLDSLFLTQAAVQVERRFGVKVTFRQLMESLPSIAAIAKYLDSQLPEEAMPKPQPNTTLTPAAAAPLAPVQGLAALPALNLAALAPNAAPGTVQAIVAEQLRLMACQLALLGGAPAASSPVQAPAPAPSPVAVPVPSGNGAQAKEAPSAEATAAAPEAYDPKKAFGAIARIHLSSENLTPVQQARLEAFVRRYTTRTKESKRLTQANRAKLADPRVVTGFKPAIKEIVYQLVVDRSRGSRVWDIDGNEYVDCLNGFGANYFGWQPPFVTEAIARQLERGHEIGPMTPLAGEVANLLCELTGAERAGFCNTGSEAVMGCMRVARTVTGRSLIASFNGSYHGIFDEVIVRGTKKLKAIPAAPGIMPTSSQNMLVLDYGTPESLEIIRQRANELAAVLIEPVQSRRPDLQPKEFLHEIRSITEKSGTACIFDEVITGFRIHPGGAQAHFGIRADIASYGKVLGGGFPIGVIAGKRAWMDALDGGGWQYGDDSRPTVGVTYFAGTFCRHPLALAAAKAVLEHLKSQGPQLQQRMNERTAGLISRLNAHFEQVGAPMRVKHFAALWKVFFTEDHPYQDLLFPMLRDRGLHILEGFPCFLTTAHTDEDVALIEKTFREAVAEMQEAGFLPGSSRAAAIDPASPPVPGARLGRDGSGNPAWFVESTEKKGQWLKVSES